MCILLFESWQPLTSLRLLMHVRVCFLSSAIIRAMNAIFLSSRTHAPPPRGPSLSPFTCVHTLTHTLFIPFCLTDAPLLLLRHIFYLVYFYGVSAWFHTRRMRVETRSVLFVRPAGGGGFFLREQHVLKWLSKGNKFMPLLTCCCPVCFVFFYAFGRLEVAAQRHSVHVGVAADHQVSPPFSVFLLYLFYLFYCVAYLAQPLDCSDFNSDISLFRLASLQ